MPHAGVAVLAENTWAALQGRRALKVEWDLSRDLGSARQLRLGGLSQGARRRRPPSRGSWCARRATSTTPSRRPPRPWKPATTFPTWPRRRWSRPWPSPSTRTANWRSGRRPRARRSRSTTSALTMLEPDPVEWLVWQAIDLSELKECEQKTKVFNEALAAAARRRGAVRASGRAQEDGAGQGQGPRDVAGRRLRAQVQARLRRSRRPFSPSSIPACRSACSGRARTTSSSATTTRSAAST